MVQGHRQNVIVLSKPPSLHEPVSRERRGRLTLVFLLLIKKSRPRQIKSYDIITFAGSGKSPEVGAYKKGGGREKNEDGRRIKG